MPSVDESDLTAYNQSRMWNYGDGSMSPEEQAIGAFFTMVGLAIIAGGGNRSFYGGASVSGTTITLEESNLIMESAILARAGTMTALTAEELSAVAEMEAYIASINSVAPSFIISNCFGSF